MSSAVGRADETGSRTVVIGHPKFQDGTATSLVDEMPRTHNSHLPRAEVVGYQQLLGFEADP